MLYAHNWLQSMPKTSESSGSYTGDTVRVWASCGSLKLETSKVESRVEDQSNPNPVSSFAGPIPIVKHVITQRMDVVETPGTCNSPMITGFVGSDKSMVHRGSMFSKVTMYASVLNESCTPYRFVRCDVPDASDFAQYLVSDSSTCLPKVTTWLTIGSGSSIHHLAHCPVVTATLTTPSNSEMEN